MKTTSVVVPTTGTGAGYTKTEEKNGARGLTNGQSWHASNDVRTATSNRQPRGWRAGGRRFTFTIGRSLYAHVDQVTLVADHGVDGPLHAECGFHATQPRVADLAAHDLRAGGHAVQLRMLRVVRGYNARHVRPVRAGRDDNRDDVAVVVDVDSEVAQIVRGEGAPLPLVHKVREGHGVRQVAALRGVDRRTPLGAVVPGDDVVPGINATMSNTRSQTRTHTRAHSW